MEKHENTLATSQREQFGSRIAFVLASMGGAIGLGNVWKFPYMVGKYGGAAFIVVYLITLLFIGAPILMTEFAIGRKTGNSYTRALKILRPRTKWHYVGIIGVIALVLTLGFYGGIAGWTVAYLFKSIAGTFTGMSADQVGGVFGTFITDPVQVTLWLAVMIGITTFVVMKGVNGGIEKVCNILLPVLFIMIVALAIRSVMLPGSGAGVEFYLKPDFSLITGEVVVAAVSQAFFTLGVGCGNLVVYGSYLDKSKTIGSSTLMVAIGYPGRCTLWIYHFPGLCRLRHRREHGTSAGLHYTAHDLRTDEGRRHFCHGIFPASLLRLPDLHDLHYGSHCGICSG